MSTSPVCRQPFIHRLCVLFRTPVARVLFLPFAALVATPALAESSAAPGATASPSATPVFYETTTVSARPVDKASGSISIIDADEIAASQARSAADLLRSVPGLNLVSNGGRAGVSHAYLRGGDPNFTLVLLDGIPLNDPTEMQGGAVNLEELSTEMVDHVEIVRGPLCAFYGVSSLSGVVQLFTRKGAAGSTRASLGLEAGDASQRRGYGTVTGKAGGA
jgi:vitamin B12 transporter